MVRLPRTFTATKIPGYFWDVDTMALFSIKIGGELRQLTLSEPNYWNRLHEAAYRVSHKGRRRNLYISYLEKLEVKDSEIGVRYV